MEMLVGFAIVIGIVIALVSSRRKKDEEEGKRRYDAESARRDAETAERKARHIAQWHAIVDRLPEVTADSSELIHTPIYDCVSDEFELPCEHDTFGSRRSSSHLGMTFGFVTTLEVKETLDRFAENPDDRVAVVEAGDHGYLIYEANLSRDPGGKIWRFVRTGADQFHVYGWRSGMNPYAGPDDPSFFVGDMALDPHKWLDRLDRLANSWRRNSGYTATAARCIHFANRRALK